MNKLNGGKLTDVKHPVTNNTNNSIMLFFFQFKIFEIDLKILFSACNIIL